MVAAELRKNLFGLIVTDTSMNTADMGTNYSGETLGMVTMEARKDIERNECECDDAQHNSGSVHGRSLLVDPVACESSEGSRGCAPLVHAPGQDLPRMQKVGDFNMNHRHPGRRTSALWSEEVLGARRIPESGAHTGHIDHE